MCGGGGGGVCVWVFRKGGTPHIQIESGHVTAQLPVSLPVLHRPEKTQWN